MTKDSRIKKRRKEIVRRRSCRFIGSTKTYMVRRKRINLELKRRRKKSGKRKR